MQSKDLSGDIKQEISHATATFECPPRFDSKKLLNSPLLQSTYAETLRMYVSVLMLRKTRKESKVGDWTIPKNTNIAVCNYSEHMDEQLWNPKGESPPVSTFWGRRFITYSDPKSFEKDQVEKKLGGTSRSKNLTGTTPRFSADGLGCKWFPFGFGERMCPGRYFAKHQMLLTFAVLSTSFEIELQVADGWKPKPDMTHFGYGIMPPASQTPFRIRRRL